MLWIGLTGGIASGKSTVAKILKNMGYDVVDADILAREVLAVGSIGYQEVLQYFGPAILLSNQSIDRAKLGDLVFSKPKDLLVLESIIHPKIQNKIAELKNEFLKNKKEIIFYDIPLLFEKKLKHQFDAVILVWCEYDQQLQRLMERNQLSRAEAEKRIQTQIPLNEKIKDSDFIIKNKDSLQNLEMQVQDVVKDLLKLSPRP